MAVLFRQLCVKYCVLNRTDVQTVVCSMGQMFKQPSSPQVGGLDSCVFKRIEI